MGKIIKLYEHVFLIDVPSTIEWFCSAWLCNVNLFYYNHWLF